MSSWGNAMRQDMVVVNTMNPDLPSALSEGRLRKLHSDSK